MWCEQGVARERNGAGGDGSERCGVRTHPGADAPDGHHFDAVVGLVPGVAGAVVVVRHVERTAVEDHVVNHIQVVNARLNLGGRRWSSEERVWKTDGATPRMP